MSVQNGERLVTKQDLADMYQDILPYLGGMPEVLANKFSKGDMYSTNEKMIGQWTNGKPLYQKTFIVSNVTTDSATLANLSDLGIETITEIKGSYKVGTVVYPQIYIHPHSPESYGIAMYVSDNTLQFRKRYHSSVDCSITIRYTKTTDKAISIGSDTDYSTTEKIVGTWMDGKPLYQKTYQLTLGSIADKTTTIVSEDISALNTEFCKVAEAQFIDSDNGCSSISSWWSSNNFYFLRAYIDNSGAAKMLKISGNRAYYSNKPVFVTIQYTKTTD